MKYIIFSLLLLLSLIYPPLAHASILYSNDFKTGYPTYNHFYGSCQISSQGLICDSAVGIYNIAFPNVQCLSSSIYVTSGYANLLFFTGNTISDDLGLEIKSGQNMRLLQTINGALTAYDTNQQPASGWQNFKICQDTNSFTAYYNNSLIHTLPFNHPVYPYVGFYLDPNVVLTNFSVSDNSSTTLYSNDFKTLYAPFNTFYNVCNSTNIGLTCNGAVGQYAISLPTLQCLSSSIYVTSAYANLLFLNSTNFNNYLGLEIKDGQNLRVLERKNGSLTGYDTGQQPATEWQNFAICQNTGVFTAYYNNAPIYSTYAP